MKFLKFEVETADSFYTNYIPTEVWNFVLVSHIRQKPKPKVEGVEETEQQEELGQALIFENPSGIDSVQDLIKEVKSDRSGKIMTRKFENKVIRSPYQVVINSKDTVENLVSWFESNVI